MEPLKPKPEAKQPAADAARARALEEYERLLAESFTSEDPARPEGKSRASSEAARDRERRIRELHRQLFGTEAPEREG